MTNLYYACNLIIDFEALDLDLVLNYIEQKHFELRILPRSDNGTDFISFALKIYSEKDMQDFIVDIGKNIFATEWYTISVDTFETGKLINISQENRAQFRLIYDSVRNGLEETHSFFRNVFYSQEPNLIYRATWKITKYGLRKGIIGEAFNIVNNHKAIQMVRSRSENYRLIHFFVLISVSDSIDDLVSQFPSELKELKWEIIKPNQLPNDISGDPTKMEPNIYSAWSQALWNALLNDN